MKREPSELCSHVLAEFAFLADHSFSESHTVGASHCSSECDSAGSRLIAVGAFLPRFEYDVLLTHNDNHCFLHELAVIMDTAEPDAPNWTWHILILRSFSTTSPILLCCFGNSCLSFSVMIAHFRNAYHCVVRKCRPNDTRSPKSKWRMPHFPMVVGVMQLRSMNPSRISRPCRTNGWA